MGSNDNDDRLLTERQYKQFLIDCQEAEAASEDQRHWDNMAQLVALQSKSLDEARLKIRVLETILATLNERNQQLADALSSTLNELLAASLTEIKALK